MARYSVKLLLAGILAFAGLVPAQAQNAYPLFEPANGVLVGDPNTYVTTAADSSDILSLWTNGCDVTKWLRGDGSCQLLTTAGQALTRTNDTNVTLTLGGNPNTSLLDATSLTLGWTGLLAPSRGGTGVSALGNLTDVDDTNVTLTLGGTPTGSLINNVSVTAGWSGLLAASRGGLGISTVTDDTTIIANGSGWVSSSLPGCLDTAGNHLNYNSTTNSIFCGTSSSVSPVTPANPTATIGLTAVNGTSPNFIRSDGAPALSQAIAPTWTQTHTWTSIANTGGIVASSVAPYMSWEETDQGVDAKRWRVGPIGGTWSVQTLNDAFNAASSGLQIARSGNTVSNLSFGNASDNPTFTFLGAGATTYGGTVTSPGFTLNASAGTIRDLSYSTAGSLRWLIRTDGTAESGSNAGSNFSIRARSDAGADLGAAMFITRSTGVTQFAMNQVQGINGSASTPSWSFVNEANTGLYRDGVTGHINFANNGVGTGYIGQDDVIHTQRQFSAGGAANASTAVQLCHSSSGYGKIGINVVCLAGGGENYGTTDVAGQIAFSQGASRRWNFQSAASGTGGTAITWVDQASLTSSGDFAIAGGLDTGTNASTIDGNLTVDPGGGTDELTVTSGAVTLTGTVVLPTTTTISGQNLCRADGTNCPAASGTYTTVFKASATDRSSTTTLTADPDLTFTSAASAVYSIRFCLVFGGVTTGTQGFKFAINGSGAGTDPGSWSGGSRVNNTGAGHDGLAAGLASGSSTGQVAFATITVGNQQDNVCGVGSIVTNGTRTYAVEWAQNSSNANATRLGQGSFLEYRRIN